MNIDKNKTYICRFNVGSDMENLAVSKNDMCKLEIIDDNQVTKNLLVNNLTTETSTRVYLDMSSIEQAFIETFDMSDCKLYTGALRAKISKYAQDVRTGEYLGYILFKKGNIYYIDSEIGEFYSLINDKEDTFLVEKSLLFQCFERVEKKKNWRW